MKLADETVTVYNAVNDPETDSTRYERTVITGVHWFSTAKSTVDSSGLKAANQVTVRIPTDADFGGKSYAPPHEFAANPDAFFTLNDGDFIVRGEAPEENPRPAQLHKAYGDRVMTILAVTDSSRAPHAPHWKAVGA